MTCLFPTCLFVFCAHTCTFCVCPPLGPETQERQRQDKLKILLLKYQNSKATLSRQQKRERQRVARGYDRIIIPPVETSKKRQLPLLAPNLRAGAPKRERTGMKRQRRMCLPNVQLFCSRCFMAQTRKKHRNLRVHPLARPLVRWLRGRLEWPLVRSRGRGRGTPKHLIHLIRARHPSLAATPPLPSHGARARFERLRAPLL